MNQDTRNMKIICNILHELKRRGNIENIDALINTAERIYHDRKEL